MSRDSRSFLRDVCIALCICLCPQMGSNVRAETSGPTPHWGGLAYPDNYSKLEVGYVGNRFTEFNGEGHRYNDIRETMGINFGTVSWTEHWKQWEGWSTNLTVGAGPTGEQPTRYLQNEFIHDAVVGVPKVPVRRTRDEADFMIGGSVTKWFDIEGLSRVFFVGAGISSGSLYFEEFARVGLRQLPIGQLLFAGSIFDCGLLQLLKGLHLSTMGQVSGVHNGAAFHDLAPQTYLGQVSLSWGIYDNNLVPFFEAHAGYTIDSGVFRDFKGNSLEERFWSVGFKIRHFSFETWNDQANRKDYGPTYGLRIAYDVYPLFFQH